LFHSPLHLLLGMGSPISPLSNSLRIFRPLLLIAFLYYILDCPPSFEARERFSRPFVRSFSGLSPMNPSRRMRCEHLAASFNCASTSSLTLHTRMGRKESFIVINAKIANYSLPSAPAMHAREHLQARKGTSKARSLHKPPSRKCVAKECLCLYAFVSLLLPRERGRRPARGAIRG